MLCSRFVPPDLAQKYKLSLPDYGFGTNQIVVATNSQRQSEGMGAARNADIQGGSEDLSAVFVTASSLEEAKTLAKGLVAGGLAACVNLIPQVSSIYMWEGKLEESSEVIMMIKVCEKLSNWECRRWLCEMINGMNAQVRFLTLL